MATKKQARQTSTASNVERTTIRGQEVWQVRSAKTGRIMTLTTSPSSKRAMERAAETYSRALQRLANR